MAIKVGDTYDLVGYKGKRTPVQVVSMSNDIATITYLDNSGRPHGSCREGELQPRDQKNTETTTPPKGKKDDPTLADIEKRNILESEKVLNDGKQDKLISDGSRSKTG